MALTLLQLTDCHLAEDPAQSYRGQNADANLKSLLPACRALAPDAVVLTGDLADDASPAAYQRLVEIVDGLADCIAWLPGNHDDRAVMTEIFDAAGFQAGPVLDWGGWQIALLDSAVPDRPEGHLDKTRLAPLDSLKADQPALVFVHHQPLPVGAPWIDKYGLVEADQLWEKLAGTPVRAVGFGHVHQNFVGRHQGIACLATPSSVANSQSQTEKFTPDPTGPKARWFRLADDGRWQSGLLSAG
jgi:3',5'-cyclic-AMP phosphodiesterase